MDGLPVGLPILIAALVGALFLLWLFTRWVVNVGPTQIAILERRYIGQELDAGRVFAAPGEVGLQAHYLAAGPALRGLALHAAWCRRWTSSPSAPTSWAW